MKVLITGADGFVARNLELHLSERKDVEVLRYCRENSVEDLLSLVSQADFIFHLAGVNRPKLPEEFQDNSDLTKVICEAIRISRRKVPVLYTSSIQALRENPYGTSKRDAEDALLTLHAEYGSPVYLFRLPNVFGKWAKPNYNSAIATFCHNIARDLPIQINDPTVLITLVYIDDVVSQFVSLMDGEMVSGPFVTVLPEYSVTVGEMAARIQAFRDSRSTLISERVGSGFTRALYSTYVSYLPKESFSYEIPKYGDPRGVFVEMLKTPDAGQFSYFTAHSGVTRGGHYHHSKTEKFLVIKGNACFKFRHMITGEFYELCTEGGRPQIVETVPGWTHDITNIGSDEMIVMLWANEIFDRARPDTYACSVGA